MTKDFEFKKFSIPSNNFLLLIFSDTYPLQFYLDELGVCGIYHSFIWSTYRLVSFTLLWLEIWKNIVCGHRIYSDKFRFKIHILFQNSHFLKFTFFRYCLHPDFSRLVNAKVLDHCQSGSLQSDLLHLCIPDHCWDLDLYDVHCSTSIFRVWSLCSRILWNDLCTWLGIQ